MVATDHRREQTERARARDLVIAAACGAFVVLMVGMAYASVPFYTWFCRVTGFGGTTQVSTAAPGEVLARTLTVRFDANVMGGLPWHFEPKQNAMQVHIGEVATAFYTIADESGRETAGLASYNVSPPTTGGYFEKINCFCFTEQHLKPHETREIAVVFYVDPSLVRDAEQDGLNTITLSYTFYPARQPTAPVAASAASEPGGRL
ncbi:MAG: cytochrome c oxidase assembly protein [Xanthobacteraceae bacterium]